MKIDRNTSKRGTLFDSAKLKVYREHMEGRSDLNVDSMKPGEEHQVRVPEDELRLAIQELHDKLLAS